ncbi:hypothetical protein [Halobacillus yeomjeoni]|uniref:Uncharacterized protein n=1 Tax=Halobacillus yeomjeoni TaxID=311194 RepID=A0A931MTQ0_9BACI|nr:hypothetical protein [Halobacillus yeomjeoni]MBH0228852.1 hypothetical protein [Halobacillus yeomjeoni]
MGAQRNLSAVLSDLLIAANHCSSSIHQVLNALQSETHMSEVQRHMNRKTTKYFIEALDSLQEIRKLSLRKKSLYDLDGLLNLGNSEKYDSLQPVFSEFEHFDLHYGGIKITTPSSEACNYDYILNRQLHHTYINKSLPASPWLSKRVKGRKESG